MVHGSDKEKPARGGQGECVSTSPGLKMQRYAAQVLRDATYTLADSSLIFEQKREAEPM